MIWIYMHTVYVMPYLGIFHNIGQSIFKFYHELNHMPESRMQVSTNAIHLNCFARMTELLLVDMCS